MRSQPLQRYFFFGTCVRYLQDASGMHGISDDEDGWGVKTNLQQFFKYLNELNLSVTSRHPAFSKLKKDLTELEKLTDQEFLSTQKAADIRNHITSLRDTLEAELGGLSAFTLTPKRITRPYC